MQFKASGALRASHRTDALVLFRPKGAKGLSGLPVPDEALKAAAGAAVKAKEFTGKIGQVVLLHGGGNGRRLLLVGLGEKRIVSLEGLRKAAGRAVRRLDSHRLRHASFLVPDAPGSLAENARAIVEGAGLAAYSFDECRSKKKKRSVTRATVAPEAGSSRGLAAAVAEGSAIVDAVSFARDLGNLPGNMAHAVYLAKRAKELSGGGVTLKVHDRAAIKRMKMGAFAAVAQASHNEPRLIEFRYRGAGARKPTVCIVGKGVTFDTGGISIKPPPKMEEMKFDMCGGAAVLGLMHLVKALKPKVNIHALVPATDNMPGGKAYRPGDIVKARNGKTIEIISTDAEGRLLLCDSLAYAAEKKPACIIDLATLTGACVVALGDAAAGLFSNDQPLARALKNAGESSGDRVWRMPLFPRYTQQMRSPYADLKNGGGRWGGACTAAAFLQEFVDGVKWAHLDIAGMAWSEKDAGYQRIGATGFGVRILWEFLKSR